MAKPCVRGGLWVRVVSFKIDEDLLDELDNFVLDRGISRSEAIRKAIELYLKLEGRKVQPSIKIVRLTS